MRDFKSEDIDPLHEPDEGCLVGQLDAKGGHIRAGGDLTVVELGAHRGTRLADEDDLIGS